jgi:hypothetical protein
MADQCDSVKSLHLVFVYTCTLYSMIHLADFMTYVCAEVCKFTFTLRSPKNLQKVTLISQSHTTVEVIKRSLIVFCRSCFEGPIKQDF